MFQNNRDRWILTKASINQSETLNENDIIGEITSTALFPNGLQDWKLKEKGCNQNAQLKLTSVRTIIEIYIYCKLFNRSTTSNRGTS